MGPAIGFGLTQPWFIALAIVLSLGLGLALPFLILSVSPGALRYLPRPGPWMVRFKQFLAFPMFATGAWLVWVLSLQAGDTALLSALAGSILIAFAIWLFRVAGDVGRGRRVVAGVIAVVALVGAGALVHLADRTAPTATAVAGRPAGAHWEPFSEARLEALRAAGRPVFVNFTAAWCITCIANEKVTLQLPSVLAAMKRANMAYLKGDWTRRNPVITRHLARFGRAGVPLYLIYPPAGSKQKVAVLPQILEPDAFIAAIERYAAPTDRRKAER
jgi:thiol:disulfide interchange protein